MVFIYNAVDSAYSIRTQRKSAKSHGLIYSVWILFVNRFDLWLARMKKRSRRKKSQLQQEPQAATQTMPDKVWNTPMMTIKIMDLENICKN